MHKVCFVVLSNCSITCSPINCTRCITHTHVEATLLRAFYACDRWTYGPLAQQATTYTRKYCSSKIIKFQTSCDQVQLVLKINLIATGQVRI